MKITFAGRDWELDYSEITLKQATVVQLHTGLSLNSWEETLQRPEDPAFIAALGALYWLMLAQDGQVVPIADIDPPVIKFMEAVGAAYQAMADAITAEAAAGAEPEPDPTTPGPGSELSPEPPATPVRPRGRGNGPRSG